MCEDGRHDELELRELLRAVQGRRRGVAFISTSIATATITFTTSAYSVFTASVSAAAAWGWTVL